MNGARLFGAIVRRDPWLTAVGVLAAVQYALLAPHLAGYDQGLTYPFRGGDTFDWLLDGLALAGEDVRYSFRPPGLPLLVAALHRAGALPLLPLLILGLHHGAAVGAHLFLRRRFGTRAAFVCGLALLTNATVLLLALQVMADLPGAILLGAACAVFLLAGERPSLYPAAGLLAGLSAITQQAALLLPLPAGIALFVARRDHLRRRSLWAGALLFALFPSAWFVAKEAVADTFTDVVTVHWGLLGFQPENAVYYLIAATSLWGWPALLLVAAGGVSELRSQARGAAGAHDAAWRLLPFLVTATVVLFFVLGYEWVAKRFLIYAFVPSLALVAAALHRLRASRAFWPLAALALVIGAWPLPRPELASRTALWPAPPLYAVVPAEEIKDAPMEALTRARIEHTSPHRVARWSTWGRVLRESRRAVEPARLDRGALAGTEIAVFLAGEPGQSGRSARAHPLRPTLGRLGYLLRRKVLYAPHDLYPDDWWGWRGLEPLGTVDRYRLFRTGPPVPGRPAVVCFGRGDPRGRELERRVRAGVGFEAPPPGNRLVRWMALAGEVDDLHRPRGGVLLILPEARGEWARLLPFLTRSRDVRMPRPGEEPSPAQFSDLEVEAVTGLGPVTVWQLEGRLRSVTVVGPRDDDWTALLLERTR